MSRAALSILLLFGAGCARAPAVDTADAGPAASPPRVASCDRAHAAGTCSEYAGAHLEENEARLTSTCATLGGAFVHAACPVTSALGDCALSTGESRKFYGTGASAYDADGARVACEDTFRGTWRAR